MTGRHAPSASRVGDAAEILVLANFAVAQPLFDVLGRNAAFFVVRRSEPLDVLLLVACLSIGVPALLVALEEAAARIGPFAKARLHGLFVAVLAALLAIQVLSRVDRLPGLVAIGIAVLIGTSTAVLLRRARPLRQVLMVLTPTPLLFAGLFLFGSPIRDVLFVRADAAAARTKVAADTPVVMVVFDEFNGTWLMDESRRIDPVRYPNLAALAGEATWFRNATTVSDDTVFAVPTILTGRMPDPDEHTPPIFASYPDNLFTLLGGSYDLRVQETVARLCPDDLCPEVVQEPFARRMRSLLLDVAVVYLHLAPVPDLTGELPVVMQSWKGFAGQDDGPAAAYDTSRTGVFARWVESIGPTQRPPLFFLHILLPHAPWRYLPSGRPYEGLDDAGYIEGRRQDVDVWDDDEWPVIQAFQRYLLQVGMVDRRIGDLVARLKTQGLYDRALVVITADHGVSFLPGSPRRAVTDDTLADILPVPLIVKAPFQREGVVSDRNVESIDILSTIADLLDVEIPWRVDGRSAFDVTVPERPVKTAIAAATGQVRRAEPTLAMRDRSFARMHALFGAGSNERIFRIGRHRDLVGRGVDSVPGGAPAGVAVDLDWEERYDDVDQDDPMVPARVKGRVLAAGAGREPLDLAVAVNGSIEAVTRSSAWREGEARFSAMVPEPALREGKNQVEVLVVSGPPGRATLRPAPRVDGVTYALLPAENGAWRIVASDGRSIPVVPGAVQGVADASRRTADGMVLFGWAADLARGRPAAGILVFVDGGFRFATATGVNRPDVAQHYRVQTLARSGFDMRVPAPLFHDLGRADVRVFALSREGVASELLTVGVAPRKPGPR